MIKSIDYVVSMDFPGSEDYMTLKRPLIHYEKGIAIIEGDKVVARFLASQFELESILLTKEWFDIHEKNLKERPESFPVFIADSTAIKKIIGFNYHQGIIAIAKIPAPRDLDDVLGRLSSNGLVAALDKLENSENTGLIVRNCAACGTDALLVGETSADPWLRRSVRNSMGNVFKLPVVKCQSLSASLIKMKEVYGYKIFGAALDRDSITLDDVDFKGNTCIVFGNEGVGLSDEILSICDCKVIIPMASGVDSFNVACASAILMYEASRQRRNFSS